MNDSLIISLELLNAAKVLQQMTQVAQAVKTIPDPIGRIAKNAQQAVGPMQRLAKAAQDVKKALASGDPARIFDAQYHFLKAQRASANAQSFLQHPNGPPFLQKLLQVVQSSRIGIGAGGLSVLPMIGELSGLLGKAGPWGMAIAAAVEGLMGFVSALNTAAQAVLSSTSGQFSLMTNAAGAARVSAAGAALGMAPSQAAQLFHQIYESVSALSGNYPGMGVAARFGVHAMGGPFDKSDEAAAIFKIIEGLQKLPLKEQEAALQKMGGAAQQLAPLLSLPLDDLRTLTRLQQNLYSPENIANAMKFNLIMATLQQVFVNAALWLWDKMMAIDNFLKKLFHVPEVKDPLGDMKNALNKHTDAMDGHTRAMAEHSRAIMGGGERARGALPAALRGQTLEGALRGHAINLGAFAV